MGKLVKELSINGYFDGLNDLVIHKITSLGYEHKSSQSGINKFKKGSVFGDKFSRTLTYNVLLHPQTIDLIFTCEYIDGTNRALIVGSELNEIIGFLKEWLTSENIAFQKSVGGPECPRCGRSYPPASTYCWQCKISLR